MTHILQVDPSELIKQTAGELKKQKLVQPLPWAKFVKTSHARDRLPDDADWWYVRAASILRSVAKLGPVGTQKLRVKYGGRKNRGHKPERTYPASGSIIRKILQQLEHSKLIQKGDKGVHKGRVLSPAGISLLDSIAIRMNKEEQKQ